MILTTAGPARFSALQAAFSGLVSAWLHDDSEHTGILPAAHIGFAFAEDEPEDWPNARLVVPAILLQNRAGRSTATFSCAVRDGDTAIERWVDELQSANRRLTAPAGLNALQRRPALLADRAFLARAQAALAAISAGELEKIVLTRSVRFDAALPIGIAPLLAALNYGHPECTIYGIGQQGQCLLGATPERLVTLENGTVQADALAGTAWPSSAANSAQPGSLKLQDDKNCHEQQLVVDAVRAALAPLCRSLDPPKPAEILQLRGLQHLRTTIAGRVSKDVGLFDLIDHLHPTPAVGGTPSVAARQWLHAHGDQRAAWYTGGIGWINRDGDGEVAVALRCARIAGTRAELFAGAGIVAGSDPAQELAETEVKLGAMIAALHDAQLPGRTVRAESSRTGTE
jgi:isochorismate synthase